MSAASEFARLMRPGANLSLGSLPPLGARSVDAFVFHLPLPLGFSAQTAP